ncbi:MAG: hypothetical protein PHF99_05260 [Bacteroidales bacterium]|nr:hypothetical protein [Bacteroidales bacterium]
MLRHVFKFFILSVLTATGSINLAQNFSLSREIHLNNILQETSGLLYCNSGFISHNDSGGKPELYVVDSTNGKIINTVLIEGAVNRDWEDIAEDDNYFYIGDFGNNSGSRTDLRIYQVKKPQDILLKTSLKLKNTFYFKFEDQTDFKKNFRETPFDCEAFFVINNIAYIFSKNWHNQTTSLYKLPLDGNIETAKKISTLDADCLITSADFNENINTIACTGYKKGFPIKTVLIFIGFNPKNESITFFKRYNMNYCNHQIEGLTWINNNKLCISNEYSKKIPAKLVCLDLNTQNELTLTKFNNNKYKIILPDKYYGKYVIKNKLGQVLYGSKIKRKQKTIIIEMPNGAHKLFIEGQRLIAWFFIP